MIAANDSIAQGASDLKAKPLARGLRLALVTAVLVAGLAARGHGQAPEPGYWERTSLPYTGLATFYAEGLMDYVQGYRLGLGQVDECPECVGAVALLRAGDIGRKVWLQAPGGEPTGPFMVVDCARRKDYPRLLARGWAVDVSYELGRLWGMDAPLGDVTVFEDPADAAAGPPAPIRAATAIAVPPGQVVITAPTSTPPPDQRMDAAASGPTPWPTRLPAARAGVAAAVDADHHHPHAGRDRRVRDAGAAARGGCGGPAGDDRDRPTDGDAHGGGRGPRGRRVPGRTDPRSGPAAAHPHAAAAAHPHPAA